MMTSDPSNIDTEDSLLQPEICENEFTKPKIIPISTKYGYIVVTQQGPPDRPAIVTYHDVGYNSTTQFHQFFAFPEMMPVTEHFTIYHINAPGQDDQANLLPTAFVYPTMDQLAVSVNDVFMHLDIKSAIGFGVGLGANVLTRFALQYPSKIYGLILVNCVARSVKWLENFSIKRTVKDMAQQHWTDALLNYLIEYHLGSATQVSDPDLVNMLRRHLEENVKAKNVIKLLNSFLTRTAIPMDPPAVGSKGANSSRTLKCSVINITGSTSPHKQDVMDTNDQCDASMASYVEVVDCGGAVLLEQPSKLAESIRLFLQGLGYLSHLSIPRYSTANRLAEQAAEYKRQHGSLSKVPRRVSTQVQSRDYGEKLSAEFDDEPRRRAGSFTNRNTQF
ncbi:unnamed protein product [Rotaria sp. Silwood2]|nr:unnamed protein product [Rotaria sp. Silwood2]CAF2759077.1 unnamed protein product [Rotaria sp. Silwood2]CAF3141234.1 unnamed protein product [Rotaria sp. Silwood2]CAF3875522.1 unnamed protein product [Rotaria sp. Silwood2]CAF4039748.1 unnamed protein product [Rotaria sp. Silwood2]